MCSHDDNRNDFSKLFFKFIFSPGYISTEGLHFSNVFVALSNDLTHVIEAAKHAPAGYRPPDKHYAAGKYLN